MGIIKFRMPDRLHSKEEMFGAINNLENIENIMCLIEDEDGVLIITIDGITAERMNWMLDRAKILLHKN